MPRTVPAGITALQGVATTRAPLFLVEIRFPGGTGYYSSGDAVSFGGNSYAANRVSISSLESGLIDRNHRNFSRIDIRLDNLADDGSANFPFTVIEGAANPEDSLVFIHIYSPDAATAVANVFWGYLGARKYDGNDKYASYTVSFFWDALDALLPTKLVHQAGFDISEGAAQLSEDGTEEMVIPVVYGAGEIKIRPLIYSHWTEGELLHVNFIVSGCNGLGFASNYLTGAKLWGTTHKVTTEALLGTSGQTAPGNLTRFPDGAAHPNVAYAYAAYQIKNEDKNRADDLKADDIKAELANGRPLLDTTLPSENPALILKDFLRDPNFSIGLPSTLFDSIVSTSNYVGTRYQMRFEFHEQMSATETVQYILANFHGFITFENGLIQIKAKRNDESSVATFATSDGGSGRKIHEDFVDVEIKDSSELVNKFSIKYRRKKRNRRWVTLYDSVAQALAGGTQKKEVPDELDQWDNGGVYEEAQAAILAAIAIREEQNGNLFISWSSPIWDCIDISVGDLVTVLSPDIFGGNTVFRVTKQTFDTGDGLPLVHFEGQVYKSAIYNDDSVALGVDLLRGGDFTDAQGRPPDVVPVSLTLIDVVTNDTEGKEATLRATWTYPVVDLAIEEADGLFREFPISEVELWWHYTDEGVNQARRGASVKHPTATADFHCQFFKSRSVECFFVAIGHNRARSPLGYVPDPTKTSYLTANLAANPAITASVAVTTNFTNGDYVQVEKEVLQQLSKTGSSITFVNDGTNRTPQFDSEVIAHPSGTEIAVAKKSYPSIITALGRRFTYPIVTGLVAIQTPDGVRFRWDDPDADNIETFLLYWSILATALTDPALLGSATAAWYLADPYAPPAGVFLSLNDDRAHKITIGEIGGAGIPVYARVAASNRRNFSSQLSASATADSTGTGVAPTATPNDPGLTDLIENVVNLDSDEADARVKVRIWADKTDHAKTFAQVGAQNAVAVFRYTGDTDTEPMKLGGALADTAATNVIVGGIFPLGQLWDWSSNILSNGTGKTKSTGAAYSFRTGAVIAVLPGDALTVPAPTFGTITRLESSNKEDLVPITITQDGTNVILFKKMLIEKSIAGGAWNRETEINLKHEETLYASSTAFVTFNVTIKRKAAVTAQYRAWVKAVGGKLSATTTSASQGATTDDGAVTPGALAFPGSLAENTVDGDPDKNLARIRVVLAAASGTFAANNIAEAGVFVVERNDANSANVGLHQFFSRPTLYAVLGGSSLSVEFYLRMGRRFQITDATAINGDKSTDTAGTLDFIAGGVRVVETGDSLTVPAPTFFAQPAADGNKIASFTIRLTQLGSGNIVLFKNLLIEVSYGGGTFRHIEGSPLGLKALDDLYTSDTASHDFVFTCKRKPGVTLDVRATAKAVGGKLSAVTNATQLASSTDDVTDDTAAPAGTLTAPTVIKLKRQGFKLDLTPPTTGNLKLRRANVYISNTAHTLWLSAADLTSSTATESVGAIKTSPSGGVTIAVGRDVLEGIFGVSATIHVYASWTNDIGTSGFSGNTSYALSGGETASRGQESTAPATTVSPTLTWKLTGERLKGKWDKPTGNIDALLGYYAVFTDNAGTAFMDPEAGTSVSEATAERFITDNHFTSRVRKADINSAFSTGLKLKITPVWQVNNVATRGTAASSSLTTLGNEILSALLDAVKVIDVSSLMGAPQNMVVNGEAGFSTATSTTLNGWRRWDKSTGISQANTSALTTTSSDLIWEQTDHRIKWNNNASGLVQKIRSLVPGDYYSLTFMAKAVGSPGTPSISVKLIKASTATDETEASPSISLTSLSTSDYKMYGAVFRFATTGDGASSHWLDIQTASSLDGSNYIVIDRVMLVRGKQPYAFVPNSNGETGNTGTEDFDVSPSSIGVSPDVGNATGGTQGGWVPPGSGAEFSVL